MYITSAAFLGFIRILLPSAVTRQLRKVPSRCTTNSAVRKASERSEVCNLRWLAPVNSALERLGQEELIAFDFEASLDYSVSLSGSNCISLFYIYKKEINLYHFPQG